MRAWWILAAVLVAVPAVGLEAKAPTAPPPPSPEPDFAHVRELAEAKLKAALFDPSSAQITYTKGFQWGYVKFPLLKRTYGWVACGSLNAKNRMGGYVGNKPIWIMSDAMGQVSVDYQENYDTPCYYNTAVPLQSALVGDPSAKDASHGGMSIADEISKLAALRDKGVLTEDEFATQKARLLNR